MPETKMKIVILAAGTSAFPPLIDKPKSLYHYNGQVQLGRVINDAKTIVDEKDIIVVGGYKYKYIERYLKENFPQVTLKVNHRYREAGVYSLRKAIENEDCDIVFMLSDESISRKNVKRIADSARKMSLLCHDTYYYYSLGIFKLRHDVLDIINDDKYLSMDYMKEVYCFAHQKKTYDGGFNINSGVCIGYMTIDFVRRIGNIAKIENPVETYHGDDIDFLHYDPATEYIKDLDYIQFTEEYRDSLFIRLYTHSYLFGKRVINKLKRIIRGKW